MVSPGQWASGLGKLERRIVTGHKSFGAQQVNRTCWVGAKWPKAFERRLKRRAVEAAPVGLGSGERGQDLDFSFAKRDCVLVPRTHDRLPSVSPSATVPKIGSSQKSHPGRVLAPPMSAFGGKADVRQLPSGCPLIAKSGHLAVAAIL